MGQSQADGTLGKLLPWATEVRRTKLTVLWVSSRPNPTPTTVHALVSIALPHPEPIARVSPVETTTYSVRAQLIEYKRETDHDYHLVISDGGETMIVEIPDPTCVGASSPFRAQIAQARSEFDAHYTATPTLHHVNVPVIVTGIGFFDRIHGQTGVAPNGIELHPVVRMDFP